MPLTNSPFLRFRPLLNIVDEPLVTGVWSLCFRGIGGVKVYVLRLMQENNEVDAKDMNIDLVIDGVHYNFAVPATMNSGIWYSLYLTAIDDIVYFIDEVLQAMLTGAQPLECSTLEVLVGIDSVAGTNQVYNLQMRYLGS